MRTTISFFLLNLVITTIAQDGDQVSPNVFSSAGRSSYSDVSVLEWSLGESFVETWDNYEFNPDYIVTEGFHQPELPFVSVQEFEGIIESVLIYPIPTHQYLTVQNNSLQLGDLHIMLFDSFGKLHGENWIETGTSTFNWDLAYLARGEYFLQVCSADLRVFNTYKVLKI